MDKSMDRPIDKPDDIKIPPPPCETEQKNLPPMDKSLKEPPSPSKTINNSMTLSTKLSTDQLICKTPQDSPNGSVRSGKNKTIFTPNRIMMVLGIFQFVLGFLMVLFGIYVIAYKASLSYLGGGVWGGILAMVTGLSGVLAAAKNFCPFKTAAEKVAHTTFLALSLISIAVSQLIVVIASTGLGRDINGADFQESMERAENMTTFEKLTTEIPQNYRGILFNAALIIVSSLECVTAAVASYRSSRELCPCFRKNEDHYQENLNMHRSRALVSSWLMGKQDTVSGSHPQIYFVTGSSSSLGRGSKLSSVMPMPVYAIQAPIIQPQIMGYSLIPAPLGPVPSPIIPPPNRKLAKIHKYYKSKSKSKSKSGSREPTPQRSRSKSKTREPQMTEEDVVRTYTGLDRAMAEEFIDICEMKNASLCSDTSCNNSTCQSRSSTSSADGCHTNSEANSQDCLVNKLNVKNY